MYSKNISSHKNTATCKKLQQRRKNEIAQDKQAKANSIKFYVYDQELETVKSFKYLGRTLSDREDDTECIE